MIILPPRRARPNISIVSLIDIIVMVLIFFVVTMVPREKRQQVPLVLAVSGSASAVEAEGTWVTVSLDPEGITYLDGEPLTGEEFTQQLKARRAQAGENFRLGLEYDRGATLQQMIDLNAQIQAAGIDLSSSGIQVKSPTGS